MNGKLSGYNTVIFDLDGTLYHHDNESQGHIIASKLGVNDIQNYMQQYNFACSIMGDYMHNRRITYRLMADFFENNIPIIRMYGKRGKNFLDCFNEGVTARVDEYAEKALDYLSLKYRLIVLTDWLRICQINVLERFNLLKYFKEINCIDGYYPKSNVKSLERIKDTENSIIVGDGIQTDLVFAKNANIPIVLLSNSFSIPIPEEYKNVLMYKTSLGNLCEIL